MMVMDDPVNCAQIEKKKYLLKTKSVLSARILASHSLQKNQINEDAKKRM